MAVHEAHVAQLAERVLGKDEVISSNLIMGSRNECQSAGEAGGVSATRTIKQ